MNIFCRMVVAMAVSQTGSASKPITKLRRLYIKTTLVEDQQPKALIVAPSDGRYHRIAVMVRDRIGELARADLRVKSPGQLTEHDLKGSNIILIGNAADNSFVRRLVWQRHLLDRWRRCDRGFVVRSVHSPFGHGKNIIFIGGDRPESVHSAAEEFLALLTPGDPLTVGWAFKTDRPGAPLSGRRIAQLREEGKRLRESNCPRAVVGRIGSWAKLCYITGDKGWADLFKCYLREYIGMTSTSDAHMEMSSVVSWWDLIEESPVFSDEERLSITNDLLAIMRSREGYRNGHFQAAIRTDGLRQNHQTFVGLLCLFAGRYFKLGYGLPEADEWLRASKKLFDSQKVSHKPVCDANSYEWLTLAHTGLWSLATGDHSFFDNGSCRTAASRAILEMDNRGNSACNGDCWTIRSLPTQLLRQALAYYGDGCYEWAMAKHYGDSRRAPETNAGYGLTNVTRGLELREPVELLGIKVAPMSPMFYGQSKANIPLAESFDKISFRRTFDAQDQYLLLDGISGGNHGHRDVNGVSHFTDNDRIWLMDISYAEAPSMRDHNVLTVMRNGESHTPPRLASLGAIADLDSVGFCKTSLPEYCGLDWHRNVFWSKERYFLFIDQLVVREPGDYTVRAHWRTPGRGSLEGTTFSVRQQAKKSLEQITRKDAGGNGKCMKFVKPHATLSSEISLTRGEWTITVAGCAKNGDNDSFYLYMDGSFVADVQLPRRRISSAKPVSVTLDRSGEHEIKLTLGKRTGTICSRIVLEGPGQQQIVLDASELEPPEHRIDEFRLICCGAEETSLRFDTENAAKNLRSYPYTEPVASIVQQQSRLMNMKTGDTHCFANLFVVSDDDQPVALEMRPVVEGVVRTRVCGSTEADLDRRPPCHDLAGTGRRSVRGLRDRRQDAQSAGPHHAPPGQVLPLLEPSVQGHPCRGFRASSDRGDPRSGRPGHRAEKIHRQHRPLQRQHRPA